MGDLQKNMVNITLPKRLQFFEFKSGGREEHERQSKEQPVINMQRAFYDLYIVEIEKRIQRLNERNNELLQTCEETKICLNTTNTETADEISQLSQKLASEILKLEENKTKINLIKQAEINDSLNHIKKVEFINEKYEKTRVSLTSQIKLINAKINTLEDYRKTQGILQDILTDRNDLISNREEEVQRTLNDIECKFKIDKEKLKKEMQNHLLNLASIFQTEVTTCVLPVIHKLLRENIALHNFFEQILNESLEKEEACITFRQAANAYHRKIKSTFSSSTYNSVTFKVQDILLKILKNMYDKMKKRLDELDKSSKFKYGKSLVDKAWAEEEADRFELLVRRLQLTLYQEKQKVSVAKLFKRKMQCKIKKCSEICYDIKYTALCIIQSDRCTDYANMDNKEILLYLLKIVTEGEKDISNLIVQSDISL